MPADPLTDNLVLGDISEQRVRAALLMRQRVYGALDGGNLEAALDGLISAWVSLSVSFCGAQATLAAANNLVGELHRLAALAEPAGHA